MTKLSRYDAITCLTLWSTVALGLAPLWATEDPAYPRVRADMKLELYCEEPTIATPVALDVDAQGRVWVIESNTHFQTEGYKRHATDRVLIFTGQKSDGSYAQVEAFTDGLTHSMGLAFHAPGQILLATRKDILRLDDTDGNDRADTKVYLARLESKGTYPHNGLTGFATDPLGFIYFAIGENETRPYRLVGTDGQVVTGGPEGGSIFRMRADGSDLQRWAVGFWNTFHLAFDGFGRLFAVDNDPDSRPPCRLLHIVRGGDYGYRRWLGRKGLHPFTAWNGELRGTLPMVNGTGEAPSAVLIYEDTGLPSDLHGLAFVTSWGDHRIETHRFGKNGASWSSIPQPLVTGGEEFRPVGIAVAPDGSVFFSDWVKRDYPVHGRGRIWRLSAKKSTPRTNTALQRVATANGVEEFDALLGNRTRRIQETAVDRLTREESGTEIATEIAQRSPSVHSRFRALVVLARKGTLSADVIHSAREDVAPQIRSALCRLLAEKPSRAGVDAALALLEDDDPAVQASAARALVSLVEGASVAPAGQPEAVEEISRTMVEKLRGLIVHEDPFLSMAAKDALAKLVSTRRLIDLAAQAPPGELEDYLLILRRKNSPESQSLLGDFLEHPAPGVRRAALHWIGVEHLTQFQSELDASLTHGVVTREVLDAYLAASGLLSGIAPATRDQIGRDAFLSGLVSNTAQPTPLRALALRCLSPTHESLTQELYAKLLAPAEAPPEVRLEAVRSLRESALPLAAELLGKIATDATETVTIRREAVIGLARYLPATRKVLESLRDGGEDVLRQEAQRALRFGVPPTEPTPTTFERMAKALSGGDPAAGEILFHYTAGPRCGACHTVGGRGGATGPDLSTAGALPRTKIVESLLEPSREIAPQFAPWVVVTTDGTTLSGITVSEDTDGMLHLGLADGSVRQIPHAQIAAREPSKTSIMPTNATAALTNDELQDLVAFLESLK